MDSFGINANGQDAQGLNAHLQFHTQGHDQQTSPPQPQTPTQPDQKPNGFLGLNLGSFSGRLPSLSSIPKPNFVSNFGFMAGNNNNPMAFSGEGKQIQNQNLIEAYALLANEVYRLTHVFVNSNETTSSSSSVLIKLTSSQEILMKIRQLIAGPPKNGKHGHGPHGHHDHHEHPQGPNGQPHGPQDMNGQGFQGQDPFRADLPPQFPPKQCDLKKLNNDKIVESDVLLSAKVLELVNLWVTSSQSMAASGVDYPEQIKGLLKLECGLRQLVNGPPHMRPSMMPGMEGQINVNSQQIFPL